MTDKRKIELAEAYINGNIADTKKAVKRMTKAEFIDFVELCLYSCKFNITWPPAICGSQTNPTLENVDAHDGQTYHGTDGSIWVYQNGKWAQALKRFPGPRPAGWIPGIWDYTIKEGRRCRILLWPLQRQGRRFHSGVRKI